MTKAIEKHSVKGGWIARDAKSGQFVSVGTVNGIARKGKASAAVVRSASCKRAAALQRLADR